MTYPKSQDPAGSDLDLLRRAGGGESEAFALLYDRHSRAIYNYCFRRTADWSAAEDLTAETFLLAWRGRHKARGVEERLLPWLYGIATNLVRTHRRGSGRRAAAIVRLGSRRADIGPTEDDIVSRVDDAAAMQRVLAAIRELPETNRDVVALCIWSGLTYAEAAIALDIPVGTVRSRLHRVRQHVRQHPVLTPREDVR